MKRRGGQGAGGFTLIEALAAIGVLMILIPVLLQGFVIAGGIAQTSRQYADATALAQSKLDELIATQGWQTGTLAGEEKVGVTNYQWDAALDNYEAEVNVQTLTLTVHWERRAVSNSVKLVTVVYLPGSTVSSSTAQPGTPLGGILP